MIYRLPREVKRRLLVYFVERGCVVGCPRGTFDEILRENHLLRCDVILALLRLNHVALAERVWGRRITRLPPAVPRYRPPPLPAERPGDDRIVVRVRAPREKERGRRRLLAAPVYQRIARAREGMTVKALLARGVRRGDLRFGVKRGYIELTGAGA